MILMGFERSCLVIFMLSSSLLSSIVATSKTYDPKVLNGLFYHHANQTIAQHKRGILTLTQVPLPSNFSNMHVSIIRLPSRSLWRKGTNSTFIMIPPRVVTFPHVKRLALVYHNLGNWSSNYYHIPGYSLVSPVIGFNVYNSSSRITLGDKSVTLSTTNEPIAIHFPKVEARHSNNVTQLKCVTFGGDGASIEIKNMTEKNVCFTRTIGSFCVVVASSKKGRSMWKWWVIGCVCGGVVAVMVLVLVGVVIVRRWKKMKMESMEKESQRGVALDTFWVGGDKMPSASIIRTQPILEHDYVP